jgi:ectoine hydroxylase-related dioxygenase (phytanoyl-CoA dioxygenase family)
MAWPLLKRFYCEAGPKAWGQRIVPMDSTSNCYIADTYAAIVASFFRELVAEGNSRPPIIIELGGGSGRFAWQFLNRLFNYHFGEDDPCIRFTYLLTDAATLNIDCWKASPRFAPLVDSGVLEFGELSIEADPVIKTASGDLRPADLADRPTIIIANYLFDSIASNLLRVRDHQIEQVYVALESHEPDFLVQPITSFKSITERFESRPVEGSPTGISALDAIVAQYRDRTGDFHVVVPEIGFAFLDNFLKRDTPFMMLAGDLAFTDPKEFELSSPLIFDTYFAHYTNFHIFAEQLRAIGGDAQFQRHGDPNFACGAFTLGGKGQWTSITLEPTRRIAEQSLKEFAPYDAHELCELIADTTEEASVRQILAWLRLSKFDPKVAEASLPLLLRQLEQGEDHINAQQIYEIYMEAYRSYFPAGEETTIDCGIAHMLMAIGYHAPALHLIRQSTAEFGVTARRLFIEALALHRLGDRKEAHNKAKESLRLDPNFSPNLRFLAEQYGKKKAAATPASSHDHLRVAASDPEAVAKSVALFRNAGAVLMENVLPQDKIAGLRAALEDRVANWQSAGLGKPNNVGDKRHTVPIRIQAPFDDAMVFANSLIINTLTEVMGERPTLHAFGAVVTRNGARMQHVHREHPLLFNDDRANANVTPYASTVLMPLIDLDEECGGTQLWEGTHLTAKDVGWEGDPHVIYTKAGSALVFDYRLYHGGMPCNADHGRPMLYLTYSMPWFVDTLAFESHAALGLSDVERLNIPDSYRDMFKFAKRLAA